MSIIVRCNCGKQVRATDYEAGKRYRCPHCRELLELQSTDRDPMAPVVRPISRQKKWYMQSEDGQTFGPVDRQQLDVWFAERRITAGCYLWQDGDKQMRYAGDVYPQLAAAAQNMPEIVAATKSVVSGGTSDAPEMHSDRGLAYLKHHRFEEAVAEFKHAIRLDADTFLAHSGLGFAYLSLGRYEEAVASCKEAIRINPEDALAYGYLGGAYVMLEQFEEAMVACKQGIRLDPDNAQAHPCLGFAYLSLKHYEEAVAAFKQAIRLDPHDAGAHRHLGKAYVVLKHFEEAVAACKEAIRLDPKVADAHCSLGAAYLGLKRYVEAAAEFKHAIHLNPENTVAQGGLLMATINRAGIADGDAQEMPEIVAVPKSFVSRGEPDASERGLGMNVMDSFRCLGNKLIVSSEYGAVTDYNMAQLLHATAPNVSNAWTHVVPVLADYANSQGKRSLFGRDKGELAYRNLEEKLHIVVLGLYGDGLVSRGASTDDCLIAVLRSLVSFKEVYPNWDDAYAAGYRVFVEERRKIRPILARHQRAVEATFF